MSSRNSFVTRFGPLTIAVGAVTLGAGALIAACSSDDSLPTQAAASTSAGAGGATGTSTTASGNGTGSAATGTSTSNGTTTGSGATSSSTGAGGATGAGGGTASSSSSGTTGSGGAGPVVRFAAFGDQGHGNQSQLDVAAAVAAKCQQDGCDFVQLLGDNFYDNGVDSTNDPQWQSKFEQPYAAIDLPFWVVLGNHDYGGNGSGAEFGKGQNEIDYTAMSMKWKLPSAYYSHVEQHVELFGLDTNMAMYLQADDQTTDVGGWLAASGATWKIVFGHHPYLSNGPHGNAGEYEGLPWVPITNGAGVKDLLDTAVCGQADLYISGHDHSRQWNTDTCNGTELIVSGAGSGTTAFEGNNPTYFQADTLGFLYVRIEGNSLTGEFIDVAGNVEYSRTITK